MAFISVPPVPEPEFTMAFQPIIDFDNNGTLFAYEALVRGVDGEGAKQVLGSIAWADRLAFDAACRTKAVELASSFGLKCRLSVNISAEAMCNRRYGLHDTLKAASRVGWPSERLIFELSENDPISPVPVRRWIASCRNRGVMVTLDHFGAGYAGLGTLLALRPDIVKLDRNLVQGIDKDAGRQASVKNVVNVCLSFGASVIAEGVETSNELRMLLQLGINLMQGYLLSKPGVGHPPTIVRKLELV